MNTSPSIVRRFVDAVHRRMIVVKFLEQMGLAFLAASILATVLVPAAIWQSMPTLPVLFSAGIIGLIGGIVLAMLRWPTRATAAAEADRQLRFDDLLGTAILYGNSSDEFARAMQQMADARCASHSPSEVIFRRFGIGSWSAIAIAMSVAVTLAVIPFGPAKSQAVDANAEVLSAGSNESLAGNELTRINHPGGTTNDPASEGSTNMSASTDQFADQTTTLRTAQNSGGKSNSASGVGGGASTIVAKSGNDFRNNASASRLSDLSGTVAGGGASQPSAGNNHDQTSQTGVTSISKSDSVSPWSTDDDSSSGEARDSASFANSDRVPPEHRDLIRDFFSGK